jgi:hypothetical protein
VYKIELRCRFESDGLPNRKKEEQLSQETSNSSANEHPKLNEPESIIFNGMREIMENLRQNSKIVQFPNEWEITPAYLDQVEEQLAKAELRIACVFLLEANKNFRLTLQGFIPDEETELSEAEHIIINGIREVLQNLRGKSGLKEQSHKLASTLVDLMEAEERFKEGKLIEARRELRKGTENFERTLWLLIKDERADFIDI